MTTTDKEFQELHRTNEINAGKNEYFVGKSMHVTSYMVAWENNRNDAICTKIRTHAMLCHAISTLPAYEFSIFQTYKIYMIKLTAKESNSQYFCSFLFGVLFFSLFSFHFYFMKLLFNNKKFLGIFMLNERSSAQKYIYNRRKTSSFDETIKEKTNCATSGNSQCNAVNINNYANEIWFNIKIPSRKKGKNIYLYNNNKMENKRER